MPAIHKSYYRRFVAILLLTLLFTPIAVYSGRVENTTEIENARIGSLLAEALTSMDSDSRVSVTVEFPDGTSTDEMVERIRLAGLESIQIRYAFQLIPMVSLSIESNEVQALAKVSLIEEITLNQKMQLLDDPIPQENYILSENGEGYVHFDEILSADLMWAEGYNGTGITIAVLDSGVWSGHPDLQDRLIGFKDLINGEDDMNPADGIVAYDDNGHGTQTC
jgi:subtilisin family serine protease